MKITVFDDLFFDKKDSLQRLFTKAIALLSFAKIQQQHCSFSCETLLCLEVLLLGMTNI